MGKKIVITGGIGYIGTELCKIYSGYSWNDKITVIDNRFISERVNQLRNWNMNFIHGDILDKDLIKKHCKDADIVHHLAGITAVPRVKSEASEEKEKEIKERRNDLKKFKISVDKTSEERAVSTGIGKILEKVLPYYKDFKIPLSDCRFLAEPLDVIVFEGASKNDVKNIIFMDVKTGNANLQKNQRQIRDLVIEKKVSSELIK